MQKSDTPGNRNTLLNLKLYLRSIIPAFLFILIAGITNDAKAVPPGVPDFTNPNTRLVVIDDSAKADGSESNIVRAFVYDDLNNPVLGAVVAFTILPSGVAFPVATNASGYADFVFVRPTVGQIVVDARIGLTHFNPTATVTFVAFEPDPDQSDLQILTDSASADNIGTNTLEAVIRDVNGNPVPNQTVTFAINSGTASFVGSATVTTDANGIAIVALISGTPGNVLISATAIGTPNVLINDIESMTFLDHTPAPSNPGTNIQITTNNAVADGIDLDLVTATVVDNYGIPVAGQSVTFNFGTNTIGAIFTTPITVTTDINGVATISLSSTGAGTSAVTATVNGLPITNGNPAAATFVAGAPDISNPLTAIIIDKDISEADGLDSSVVHVHIADQFGNPVANQTILFAFTGTAGSGPLSLFTDANGNATLKLASTTIGTNDVSATVNGTPLINGNPSTVHFVIGAPDVTVSNTHLNVVTTGAVANNIATDAVKATITDKGGHLLQGETVIFSILSGTGNIIGSGSVLTDINGEATIFVVSTLADTVRIIATVNGDTLIFGSPAKVYFIAGPPDLTNPLTLITVIVDSSVANGTAQNLVIAHIVDQYGNPTPNQTIAFAFSGAANAAGPLTLTTNAGGNAALPLTSTTIGSVLVTANVNGSPIINGNPSTVHFIGGEPEVKVPTTRLEVITTGAVADSVATNAVKAIITDTSGHLLPGQTVIFKIFSGTGSIIGSGTVVTDINGEAAISLVSTLADTVLIIAIVNGDTIIFGSPAEVYFVAGPPDLTHPLTVLVVAQDGAAADGVAQNILRAHIVDKYGNPVPGQTITFNYLGVATPGGPLTITTDPLGNATISLTSSTVGPVVVTATVNGIPLINGNPSTVHFVIFADTNNPLTQLSTVDDNAIADGSSTNSVRAHVVDNEGNPMPGVTVVFTIASGDGTMVTPQTVTTDVNGNAFLLISSNTAGYVTVTATANGKNIQFGSPARVRFTSVDVWVPKVFTPNGDGVNDMVRAIANGITVQYFNIYNRWGNLLFTTPDITQGWDGRFKGVVQPNET
ncbi:MAG TPA: Ig-like domain-containing protein [Flavitalea sp.]|nr:Ig-like domain-containing protein [Flavitalea sp.]